MCNMPMTDIQIQSITVAFAKRLVKQKEDREDGIANASTLPVPDIPKLVKGHWRLVRDAFIEMLS